MKHAALAPALLALLAAPLAAQRPALRDTSHGAMMEHAMPAPAPAQGMPRMMGCSDMMGSMMNDSAMSGMMEGMMRVMAGSAAHVLASKAALQLTADQERRIAAIRDAAQSTHDTALRDARGHQRELDRVLDAAAPDTNAMKAHFAGGFAAMGQAHLAMLRSAALTRAVLTDAQRHQLDSLRAGMGRGMTSGRAAPQPAHRH